jgi:DNA-directed RNA polymerase specialized sigma24 family protein
MQSTTPSRIAMYREQAAAMAAALASLPEDLGEVVRLRLIDQRSMGEIAASLGIGVEAVRHRLRRGAAAYHRRLHQALVSRSGACRSDDATLSEEDSSSGE